MLRSGEVLFYVKGADSVMMDRVSGADWVEEEVGNLAREGLRTLVVAYRSLTEGQYAAFAAELHKARFEKLRTLVKPRVAGKASCTIGRQASFTELRVRQSRQHRAARPSAL